MGAGASTHTIIQNEYNFSGNNNGITSGDQGVYGTTTGASTDVKPTSDMNYSPQINPDFGAYLNLIGNGNRAKVVGVVSKTNNLIDSVRHIGAAAYRVAMGDDDLIDKAKKIVNTITEINDSTSVLDGSETIDIEAIKGASELQLEVVKRLPSAHDAYSALALGMTGMRNNELNTRPTVLSLAGCFDRASEGEKLNSKEIVSLAGPRMGVVPRSVGMNSSTIIQETLDNTMTEHGTVGDLKTEAKRMSDIQKRMKCSVLHANSRQLADAGMLPTDSWETNEIIGMMKQHSIIPKNLTVSPGGFVISTEHMIEGSPFIDNDGIEVKFVGITNISLDLTREEHHFRDVYVILNGRVSIYNQPLPGNTPGSAIKLGLAYADSEDNFRFNNAYFVNSDIDRVNGNFQLKAPNHQSTGVQCIPKKFLAQVDDTAKYHVAPGSDAKPKKLVDVTALGDGNAFSFDSPFQIVANLSKMKKTSLSDMKLNINGQNDFGPFRAYLFLGMGERPANHVQINISVATPIVRIETTENPEYMIYMGDRYSGSILDLLGKVPEWYSTGDHHDPVFLYKKFIEPLIPFLGMIASHHLESNGAALQLTRDHIIRAYNNLSEAKLDTSDIAKVDEKIRRTIIKIHEVLYNTGTLKDLKDTDKKVVFMHILEKVINQSLTHINVWRDRTIDIRDHYARDCKEFNAVELQMDKKRGNQC